MKKTILELPLFYASYLINGELDNYNEEEIADMEEIEQKYGYCVDVNFDTQDFRVYKGILNDVCDFTFLS